MRRENAWSLRAPAKQPGSDVRSPSAEVPVRSAGLEGRRPLHLGRILRGSLTLAPQDDGPNGEGRVSRVG